MPRVLRYAIRQNVKSTAAQTADGHERRKDFLGEPELAASWKPLAKVATASAITC
jgi:hypothetical protein